MFDCNNKKYTLVIVILFKSCMSIIIRSFLINILLECLIIRYITKIDYLNCVD